MIFVEGKG